MSGGRARPRAAAWEPRRVRLPLLIAGLLAAWLASPVTAQWGRGTVSGLVFGNSDTQGLAGAKVELVGNREDERLREVQLAMATDAAGKYAFERVPYGRYEFRVSAPGYLTYSISLYVASDAHTQLHVQLRRETGRS